MSQSQGAMAMCAGDGLRVSLLLSSLIDSANSSSASLPGFTRNLPYCSYKHLPPKAYGRDDTVNRLNRVYRHRNSKTSSTIAPSSSLPPLSSIPARLSSPPANDITMHVAFCVPITLRVLESQTESDRFET
ncbi:hypothetical protein BKA56DRAFT_624050 [Ilyonectria sp. MPI-CAGE-AT-0026]|nr:hypothetical protein BKA56DRAFT_624050 [Ilyonectria sp. MPI-CAGE-AT-0026]